MFMYETEIKALNHQGMGIGRINNKVVFVEDGLVGEKVLVKIVEDNKKYMVAKIVKRLTISKDRCKYDCIYYDRCGGCNIASLIYEKQLEFKKGKVIDIFKKYVDVVINPKIIKTNEYHYRNKIVMHVENGKMGYYEKNTNKVVPIDKCLIASDTINKILKKIEDNIDLDKVKQIMIRSTYKDSMVVIEGEVDVDNLIKTLEFVTSIYVNKKLVYGKSKIIEKIGDYLFYISCDSFFQVNTNQAYNLYNQVLTYANLNKDDVVLDLYCGTGTIGIYLAKYCKSVLGIEINKMAIMDANENKKLNNIDNISFINGSASIINKLEVKANVVVVDPPRSGLDNVTIDTLIKMKVDKIIYVSCDPMTLSRDIKRLSNVYKLADITLFDMFAQDYHVESVCVLNLC